MLSGEARRRLAALRQPGPSVRLARALWLVWAIIVWNAVFDHIVVRAGRTYIAAAERAAAVNQFLNMDDWMRPGVMHGLSIATATAVPLLLTGFLLLRACAPNR
jgi:hypothetical protein